MCICQPWFLLPVLRMLKSQCCGPAAARQHQGAEGMPWFARQSYRGNVQWHYQKAPLLWSEFSYHCVIKLHLSDSQITICTGLMGDFPILCVLLWERNTKNQLWNLRSPLLSQLWVKQILDWFENWCVWLNEEEPVEQSGSQTWAFIPWSEGLTVSGAAWGFESRGRCGLASLSWQGCCPCWDESPRVLSWTDNVLLFCTFYHTAVQGCFVRTEKGVKTDNTTL